MFLAPFRDPNDPKKITFPKIYENAFHTLLWSENGLKWVYLAFLLMAGPKFGPKYADFWPL